MNKDQVSKIAWFSIGLMVLTSIHHAYGAVIYDTPWRLHVLMISIPVIVVTLLSNYLLKKKEPSAKSFLFWAFYLVTLVPSIGMIGVFEGIYNHILKNVLYFGSLNENTLQILFPSPKYEMPNDLLFEVTGVLQGIVVVPMLVRMMYLTSSLFKNKQLT